jgi:hypothetical protein
MAVILIFTDIAESRKQEYMPFHIEAIARPMSF